MRGRIRIRQLEPDDLPGLARLYVAAFGGGQATADLHALEGYLHAVFLGAPWITPSCPSLVSETSGGSLVGFLGVIPRRFVYNDQPVLVAVTSSLAVDPAWRSHQIAVRLLREHFAGPQQLSLTDAANHASRAVWEALGGETAFLYSMAWTRQLRPARALLARIPEKRPRLSTVASLIRWPAALLDVAAARLPPNRLHRPTKLTAHEVDAGTLLNCLSALPTNASLRPCRDRDTFEWLLALAAKKRRHGVLKHLIVRDSLGNLAAACSYYSNPGSVSQVLHLHVRDHVVEQVLHQLFHIAWAEGALEIHGRLDPRWLATFTAHHCAFRCANWVLIYSRCPRLRTEIHAGRAELSRLDGEWWTSFLDVSRPTHVPDPRHGTGAPRSDPRAQGPAPFPVLPLHLDRRSSP